MLPTFKLIILVKFLVLKVNLEVMGSPHVDAQCFK